ncbi:hypothetical protein ABIB40_003049 [Pedobacter sp. UYP30]|uniref:hypothetical protein n=1 Tax=Pedobacter sp. UYP30 TaxID=1756400 RepID=UPI00339543BB
MKKLAHTSPFLLLLLPVFMMIVLTISVNANRTNRNDDAAIKTTTSSKSILQTAVSFFN